MAAGAVFTIFGGTITGFGESARSATVVVFVYDLRRIYGCAPNGKNPVQPEKQETDMRHITASIVCAAALALGIAGYNYPVSAHGDSGGTLGSRIYGVATSQLMPDSARRIAGRLRAAMRPPQAAQ